MIQIPDHPQIRWAERTGYPSWCWEKFEEREEEEDDFEGDGDVYYGNETDGF